MELEVVDNGIGIPRSVIAQLKKLQNRPNTEIGSEGFETGPTLMQMLHLSGYLVQRLMRETESLRGLVTSDTAGECRD